MSQRRGNLATLASPIGAPTDRYVVGVASDFDEAAVSSRCARLRLRVERTGTHRMLLYDADDGALIDAGTFDVPDDAPEDSFAVRWPFDVEGARVPLEPGRRYACEVRYESDGALVARWQFATPCEPRHRSGVHRAIDFADRAAPIVPRRFGKRGG